MLSSLHCGPRCWPSTGTVGPGLNWGLLLRPLPASPHPFAHRSVHRPQEEALARSMERHRHASPADLGLSPRLFPTAPGRLAYGAAIEELCLIPLETCPRRKLDCIGAWPGRARAGRCGGQGMALSALLCAAVRALRSICECAEEYCSTRDSRAATAGTM